MKIFRIEKSDSGFPFDSLELANNVVFGQCLPSSLGISNLSVIIILRELQSLFIHWRRANLLSRKLRMFKLQHF